jgi:hypothetical protein
MVLDMRDFIVTDFYEYVTIRTTDPILRRVKCAVFGTMNLIIRVKPASVVLPTPVKKDTFQNVRFISREKGLKITGTYFEHDHPKAEWLSRIPIRFAFTPAKTPDSDGLSTCMVTLFHPRSVEETMYGKFIFQTNHPHKSQMRISGVIDPL